MCSCRGRGLFVDGQVHAHVQVCLCVFVLGVVERGHLQVLVYLYVHQTEAYIR